jgi:hypothetical protein
MSSFGGGVALMLVVVHVAGRFGAPVSAMRAAVLINLALVVVLVVGGRLFLPGHDQRAIPERIARRWGDTLGFIT